MQKFKPSELIPHPQNGFFFDDMEGQKWNEFLESVKTSGVIEPPVVTSEGVIVSGHQRVRACMELGIDEIYCEVRLYDDPERVVKDLIETNIRQRGTIGGSDLKMGRIIKELERIYGVKRGGDKRANPHCADLKPQSEIAKELGVSVDMLNRLKKLTTLPEEFQEMVESGTINAKTGYTLISKLTEEEQTQLLSTLPAAQKFTQSQIQQYIDEIRGLREDNAALEEERDTYAQEAVEATRAAKSATDSEEYLRMVKKLKEEQERARGFYEEVQTLKKSDKTEQAVEEATDKVAREFRRLIDLQEKKIAELEGMIAERETTNESDNEHRAVRAIHIDRTPDEETRAYFNFMQNETGGFLSSMEGLALQKEHCANLSADKRAFLAENLRTIMNRCAEVIDFIRDCKEVA